MMRMLEFPILNLINEHLLPNFVDCSLRLAGYVIFVLAPFPKIGYAVMPPIVSMAIGGLACPITLGVFLLNLNQLRRIVEEQWRLEFKCKTNYQKYYVKNHLCELDR